MTGVASAILQRWFENPKLAELVPAGQVIIGPPSPGWKLPGVAIVEYERARGERTSDGLIDLLEIVWSIESDRAEEIDQIADAILNELPQFTVGTRRVVNWRDYRVRLSRDAESDHFRAEMVTTFNVL